MPLAQDTFAGEVVCHVSHPPVDGMVKGARVALTHNNDNNNERV